MATDYPIEITDPDGSVRIAGLADFPDPDNMPGTGGPFQPPVDGTVTLLNTGNGNPELTFDDATAILNMGDIFQSGEVLTNILTVSANATEFQANGTGVGFYGTPAVAQPQVPATPLPQDIVDALVLLGLVSQAS